MELDSEAAQEVKVLRTVAKNKPVYSIFSYVRKLSIEGWKKLIGVITFIAAVGYVDQCQKEKNNFL